MPVLYGAIMPHPPALIPSIGGKEHLTKLKSTLNSYLHICQKIAVVQPDLIVVMSPHGVLLPDQVGIRIPPNDSLIANLKACGGADAPEQYNNDSATAYRFVADAQKNELLITGVDDPFLDYGTLVPLYYVRQALGSMPPLLCINISLIGLQQHFDIGEFLRKHFETDARKIVVIGSADLSHCVTEDAPLPYSPEGKKFDKTICAYMQKENPDHILLTDPFLTDEVHACGMQVLSLMRGVFSHSHYIYSQLSYEAPFGVGYLAADYTPKIKGA